MSGEPTLRACRLQAIFFHLFRNLRAVKFRPGTFDRAGLSLALARNGLNLLWL